MSARTRAEFDAAWTGPGGAAPKKPICRPLYPEKVTAQDRARVLRALLSFLHRYGYWPAPGELAAMLQADYGAVVHQLGALFEAGLVERTAVHHRRAYYQLTAAGWTHVGVKPIAPWIRRPKSLLTRITHQVTVDLADLEAARARRAETAPSGPREESAPWA